MSFNIFAPNKPLGPLKLGVSRGLGGNFYINAGCSILLNWLSSSCNSFLRLSSPTKVLELKELLSSSTSI